MHVLAFAFLSMPIFLEDGTFETQFREMLIPVTIRADLHERIRTLRLFSSTDRGENWHLLMNLKKGADNFPVVLPADGLYWFACQTIENDGEKDPAEMKDLSPALKVYVNTAKRPILNRERSFDKLYQEVVELRQTVEQLRRKVKVLESKLGTGN